ncbi:MAG: hypothetical protein IJ716_17195 [Lachnospiraceae bacterium]|nr:hypothetical protein [Lachnospiraceae bacterium]
MKGIKKKKGIVIAVLIFLLFYVIFHYGGDLGHWRGKSFQTYSDRAYQTGSGGFLFLELPVGAQDFRFQCENYGFAARSVAAMTLTGQEYDEFMSVIANIHRDPEYYDKLHFEGKKVSETFDCYDDYGYYIGFPKSGFQYVIDDDIMDYTILYYDGYRGAGVRISAVVARPDTGRIVIYNYGSN